MNAKSATWTYYDGRWQEGDVRILGAASHATWLGSLVFDGAIDGIGTAGHGGRNLMARPSGGKVSGWPRT
jgi:hypothetical protein